MAKRFQPDKNALGQMNRAILSVRNQKATSKAAGKLAQNTMQDLSPIMFTKALQAADVGAERLSNLVGTVAMTFPNHQLIPQAVLGTLLSDLLRMPMSLTQIMMDGLPNPAKFQPAGV